MHSPHLAELRREQPERRSGDRDARPDLQRRRQRVLRQPVERAAELAEIGAEPIERRFRVDVLDLQVASAANLL